MPSGLSIHARSAVGFMRDLFEFFHPRLSVPPKGKFPFFLSKFREVSVPKRSKIVPNSRVNSNAFQRNSENQRY